MTTDLAKAIIDSLTEDDVRVIITILNCRQPFYFYQMNLLYSSVHRRREHHGIIRMPFMFLNVQVNDLLGHRYLTDGGIRFQLCRRP